jgi:hypothetical protein
MTDAPVLCNVCNDHPDLRGLVVAGVLRDDSLPPRCPLCGFVIGPDGERVENDESPASAEAGGALETT